MTYNKHRRYHKLKAVYYAQKVLCDICCYTRAYNYKFIRMDLSKMLFHINAYMDTIERDY